MRTKYTVGLMAASVLAFATVMVTIPAAADDDQQGCPGMGRGAGMGMMQGQGMGMMQGQGMGMGMGQGRGFMRRFAVIDANDDDRISADEAASQRESVFLAMDADDDGELTEDEYMAVRMGMGEGRNKARMEARQAAKKARFAPMDADKSGKVSKVEWMTGGKDRFEAADTDKDGIVTPWEFRSMHQG